MEAAKENMVVDDGKKKVGSGLLSFFGRRTASSQSDSLSRSNSPGPPISSPIISSLKTGSSPRASTENTRSTATTSSSQNSGRTTPVLPAAVSPSSSTPTQKNDSNPAASSAALDPIVREATPPPSAVSRFLGRFSSRATKQRDSLALSQDDLEFLSDVPTLNESESNHDLELNSLSMMIKSPPLPTTLPPPLAPPPPPRPSQPTWTLPLAQATKLENDPMDDDPFSIFIASDSASKHTQPLTATPTPPVRDSLSNPSLSSTTSPLAHSHSSGNTISNQGWSSFGDLPAPVNGILPVKRPVVGATMISSISPPVPKPKPKSNATFPILSPGPSSQHHWPGRDSPASGSTSVISPLPPPPGSRSHTPSHTPSVQAALNFDDDDFSDFLSSPAQSAPPVPPSFAHNALSMNLANSSSSTSQTPTTTINIFDGLDDFLGPFSSDPPPPPLPAKPKPQPFVSSPKLSPPGNRRTYTPQHSRTVSKADHSRTLSLLENVAAHGQWLGPASPLPEALPPPVSSNMKSSSNDFFQHGSTMQAQQAQALAARSASFQAQTDEKSRSQNSSLQLTSAHLLQLPMSSQPSSLKPPTLHISSINPAGTPEVKSSGLSAQDLSFFEGL